MRGAYVMSGERSSFYLDADPHGALFDIASATCSFGEDREWTDCYHFLLAEKAPFEMSVGGRENPPIEALATAAFAIYPEGFLHEPYRGFERDVLDTLGRAIMSEECWVDGRIRRGEILCREQTPWSTWGWNAPCGDLSASIFLRLKYLTPEQIGPWLKSVLSIEDRYWRAQLMAFFAATHALLTGRMTQPAEMAEARPSVSWENSFMLEGVYHGAFDKPPKLFLHRAHCDATLAAVAEQFSQDVLLDWLCSISEDAELEAEIVGVPEAFSECCLARG